MKDFWVILDTNFLMVPESYGVDIFDELKRVVDKKFEIVIPETVIDELNFLMKEGSTDEQRSAEISLELSERGEIIESEKQGDEEIIRLAEENESAVGTNDKGLKKKLRERRIPVIYLRQKSYLCIGGMI